MDIRSDLTQTLTPGSAVRTVDLSLLFSSSLRIWTCSSSTTEENRVRKRFTSSTRLQRATVTLFIHYICDCKSGQTGSSCLTTTHIHWETWWMKSHDVDSASCETEAECLTFDPLLQPLAASLVRSPPQSLVCTFICRLALVFPLTAKYIKVKPAVRSIINQ